MLVLAVSDIHGKIENLKKIVELIHNKSLDLVLVLGDLTDLGGASQAEQVLGALPKVKVLAIAGNFDTGEVEKTLEGKGISLHAKKKQVGKWHFVGFGGGLVGDPGRFLFSEEEIEKALLALTQDAKNLVLVTHLPPFGTKIDLAGNGVHIGSRAVRETIEKRQPVLHLCGHCHEGFGAEQIGKTLSVNVGAVKEGKALLLELGEKPKWKRLQL